MVADLISAPWLNGLVILNLFQGFTASRAEITMLKQVQHDENG